MIGSSSSAARFPTPTLSLGERENPSQSRVASRGGSLANALTAPLPLPEGEGWGEGETRYRPALTWENDPRALQFQGQFLVALGRVS